eukprot:scaffold2755_cov64-Phaeocystis_antarctica.AAC.2
MSSRMSPCSALANGRNCRGMCGGTGRGSTARPSQTAVTLCAETRDDPPQPMPGRVWADELGSCVTDVIASRPEDPLKQLAHLLSRSNARPDWNETASAYAKRHNLEQQLGAAIDAAGLTHLKDSPPEAMDRLCEQLLALAQPQVAGISTMTLREEVASLKREVGRLHDDRLAAPKPRSMATSGGTVLALALGGSSDVIGALAWARASGYERL